jgi:membrane-associated phosphatidylinositol transfer protein
VWFPVVLCLSCF